MEILSYRDIITDKYYYHRDVSLLFWVSRSCRDQQSWASSSTWHTAAVHDDTRCAEVTWVPGSRWSVSHYRAHYPDHITCPFTLSQYTLILSHHKLMPKTHTPETGAINRLRFLVPVFGAHLSNHMRLERKFWHRKQTWPLKATKNKEINFKKTICNLQLTGNEKFLNNDGDQS